MISAALNRWLAGLMVFTFALLAGGLVTYDILRRFVWHPPSISVQDTGPSDQAPPRPDEIRKYVQFAEVALGANKIVTGVERASDRDRRISSQWCYIARSLPNGRRVQLTLAEIDGADVLSVPRFSPAALADFDLTQARARDLVDSHCRFQ